MRNLLLAAGVAALAISGQVAAKPDKGEGGGKPAKAERAERGGGKPAKAERAERGGGNSEKAERSRGGDRKMDKAARRDMERGGDGAGHHRQAEKRGKAFDQRNAEVERRAKEDRKRNERWANGRAKESKKFDEARRSAIRHADTDRREFREDRRMIEYREAYSDRVESRYWDERELWERSRNLGIPASFVGGCPPGLAKKSPACVPPGQARKNLLGSALPTAYASHVLPAGLRDLYYDSGDSYWRYGDGYAYQVDRSDQLIRSVLPLIGAGLGIGMPFPYQSQSYYLPTNYQPFYPENPYTYYRYANGYAYEIDRDSGMIVDVVPILDQGYGVGQMLPASYDYYNVPYQYRDLYRDDADYAYRYAPGAIYQVDQKTQLITAIAALLTGGGNGLSVGQPLPMGYDAYNVPMGYRDQYYDTPDNWYRYADGQIYEVDPTTRLITAIIEAIV